MTVRTYIRTMKCLMITSTVIVIQSAILIELVQIRNIEKKTAHNLMFIIILWCFFESVSSLANFGMGLAGGIVPHLTGSKASV